MTALCIIAAIIFLIWLILFQYVTVDFSFLNKQLKVKIKYCAFTVFDLNKYLDKNNKPDSHTDFEQNDLPKPKADIEKKSKHIESENTAKRKSNADIKPPKANAENKRAKKMTIEDKLFEIGYKIDYIKQLYDIGKGPVFKVLHGICLTGLFIDFDIADDDAYDCAIKFGNMNALVFNSLAALSCLFKVKKKSINIKCVYDSAPPKYDAAFYLKLRPTTVLSAGICLGVKYLIYFVIKPYIKSKKRKKKRAVAKSA